MVTLTPTQVERERRADWWWVSSPNGKKACPSVRSRAAHGRECLIEGKSNPPPPAKSQSEFLITVDISARGRFYFLQVAFYDLTCIAGPYICHSRSSLQLAVSATAT